MFDVPDQPLTQFVGGIFRKQAFQYTKVNNTTPWNMSYSLASRAMSRMSNPNVLSSVLSVAQNYSQFIKISLTTVVGMLPMFY